MTSATCSNTLSTWCWSMFWYSSIASITTWLRSFIWADVSAICLSFSPDASSRSSWF
jgi:hypothetical protein